MKTPAAPVARQGQGVLMKAFWGGVGAVLLIGIFSIETTSAPRIAGACLIACAALLPSFLWCSSRAMGMPIFPVFALTYLLTYALPLVGDHPVIAEFSSEDCLFAGFTVAGFLALATAVWFQFVSTTPKPPSRLYMLKSQSSEMFLLLSLASGVLYNMAFVGGWFDATYEFFDPLRNTVIGLLSASVFVVVCFKGRRQNHVRKYGVLLSGVVVVALACAGAYLTLKAASWILPAGPESIGRFISVIRTITAGLSVLAIFVLAFRWGQEKLPSENVAWFVLLLTLYMTASAATLLLVEAMATFFLAAVAFTIGRRSLPRTAILCFVLFFMLLHVGKAAMRNRYWFDGAGSTAVQPWEYPARLIEWVGYSLLSVAPKDANQQADEGASLAQRASLMHLLLLTQRETADKTPLLYGETYAIIPELLVPRFIMPDKPTSHEGTTLLNIHYGIQTREDTASTTIGWGLLNEAYANFGLLGCAALAVIIGAAYGKVARWSVHAPLLSFRFLFTILILSLAFQTEFPASVYLTALFQSSVALFAVTILLMEPFRSKQATATVAARRHGDAYRFNRVTPLADRS